MTFAEFNLIVEFVAKECSPFSNIDKDRRTVKYIDPHFDMRTMTVYSVGFRGLDFGPTLLHVMNESRHLPDSLFDRCVAFLKKELEVAPVAEAETV
jgi:hypothetical protein